MKEKEINKIKNYIKSGQTKFLDEFEQKQKELTLLEEEYKKTQKFIAEKKEQLIISIGKIEANKGHIFIDCAIGDNANFAYNNQKKEKWTNIHHDFSKKQSIKNWLDNGFDFNQTREWIDIGFSPHDFHFAKSLEKQGWTPEKIINESNVETLRKKYHECEIPLNFDPLYI